MIKKVDNKSLKVIASNLGNLHKAGINLEVAVEILQETVSNKDYKDALRDIKIDLKKGISLGECFKNHSNLFPNMFCQFIVLGEENGQLEKILTKISLFYTKTDSLKKKIKNLLIYPKILIISCILISMFSILTLVPQIANIYDSSNGELPYFLGIMYKFSTLIKENPVYSLSVFICYGIIMIIIFKALRIKDKFLKLLKKTKIFKLYYEQNIIFMLYIIFSSGSSLDNELRCMKEGYEDDEIKNRIDDILKIVNRGENLSSYFKSKNYSQSTYTMIKVGNESGGLEEKLEEALNIIEEEFESRIQRYVSCIQPISVGIVGIFITFIMLTTLMPMFSAIGVL